MDLAKSKKESQDIYETLRNSQSMYWKCIQLESENCYQCLRDTLAMVLSDRFPGTYHLSTGSLAEGTDITLKDYGNGLPSTPCSISDVDVMQVLCQVHVIDEGDPLPQRFGNYVFCQAVRGEHTTDGYRKLREINPEYYPIRLVSTMQLQLTINSSIENGYISSSKFMATTLKSFEFFPPDEKPIISGVGTKGPSHMAEQNGSTNDMVTCFYVKTWPKEADSWFTRETHWPDRKLKIRIKKIGYLLVPTGNSNSQENRLEWRCSFSIAEKILFQSMTQFQRCTCIMFKVLLKEYLPSDINIDGEKQLLSTYHIKTVFLWCLEDSTLKWEPDEMLAIIGHLLDVLVKWLKQLNFPHYFIPSVNLFGDKQLHGKENCLIHILLNIKNNLSNKIDQSQFLMAQKNNPIILNDMPRLDIYRSLHCGVVIAIMFRLHTTMHRASFVQEYNFTHSMHSDRIIDIKIPGDPQVEHFYRAIYTDPIHDKLLTKVLPGYIKQLRGRMHLVKYCMAARDGRVLPGVLHTAESLLKDTLHLDPCSGYVKLAFLYIATGDLVRAMSTLGKAEDNFYYAHKHMEISVFKASQSDDIKITIMPTNVHTFFMQEVFEKWVEGLVTSNTVVTWQEFITVPDLLQFELIHEGTKEIFGVSEKSDDGPFKVVERQDFKLEWPVLSIIKLLKFVCNINSGQRSRNHLENLVTDLIFSSVNLPVLPDDKCTVFNMAALCYIKIQKYQLAAIMMMGAIGRSPESNNLKRCAFSRHFVAYVIAHCLAEDSRVLVYERNTLAR